MIFKDIDWFFVFSPHVSAQTFFNKSITHESHDIFVEACLLVCLLKPAQVGALWNSRVYPSPVQDIPNFSPTIIHIERINLVIVLRMWGTFTEIQ